MHLLAAVKHHNEPVTNLSLLVTSISGAHVSAKSNALNTFLLYFEMIND